MYLDHWSLERSPFEAQPDSRFLFATAHCDTARAAISYAACEGGEPVLITGPAGCGKTLLLRALRRGLPRDRYHVAFVPEVACSQVGLLRRVAYHLAHTLATDAAAAMDTILQHGADSARQGAPIVVMLDDWPLDSGADTLTELRWLLNVDLEGGRLCVLLAGEDVHPEQQWPGWLVQRLFTTVTVAPMAEEEVPTYLAHRLRVAAAAPDDHRYDKTFAPEAAALVAEWSGGVPRLVNRLAHLALHAAYLDLASQVTPDAVQRALERITPDLAQPVGASP